jgi:hypothetical protein
MENESDGSDLMEKLEKVRSMDPGAIAILERIVDDLLQAEEQEIGAIRALYLAELKKQKENI